MKLIKYRWGLGGNKLPPTPLHHPCPPLHRSTTSPPPQLYLFFPQPKPIRHAATCPSAPAGLNLRRCIWPPSTSDPRTPLPPSPPHRQPPTPNSSGLSSQRKRETRAPPGSASAAGRDSVTPSRSDAAPAVTPYPFLQRDRSHRLASPSTAALHAGSHQHHLTHTQKG